MITLAGLIAGLFAQWLGKISLFDSPIFLVAAGFLMVLLDLGYRTTRGELSLLSPRRGGHFFFMPVWVFGGFVIMFNFVDALDSKPNVSARQSNPYAKASVSQNSSYPAAFASSSEQSYQSLKLGMISGGGANRIATVNGQPFAEGESHTLTIDSTKRLVQCTKIREQSVLLTISGDPEPRELKMG